MTGPRTAKSICERILTLPSCFLNYCFVFISINNLGYRLRHQNVANFILMEVIFVVRIIRTIDTYFSFKHRPRVDINYPATFGICTKCFVEGQVLSR